MKKHLIALGFVAATTGAMAQTISIDEAREVAVCTMKRALSRQGSARKAPTRADMQLGYTAKDGLEPVYYVFNNASGGFVIVGADARMADVLGYTTQGTFDYNHAPDNLKWWLSQYEAQPEGEQTTTPVPSSPRFVAHERVTAPRHDVAPLLKTLWNQDAPYNSEIPHFENLATGCVSTATSQIMKYYSHPVKGKGSYEYTFMSGLDTYTFGANFGETTYEWDKMLNSYASTYTAAQAKAVGTLMYHVAVACNTSFGYISQGGSQASINAACIAMISYFDYDKSMIREYREYYSDQDWEEMIYTELAEGRPILYGGHSENSSHAFVCHGYSKDDNLYAINWGWGGLCDGYYRLTGTKALQPESTGIGATMTREGYCNRQEIVRGIRPDEGGHYITQIAAKDGYMMTVGNAESDKYIDDRTQASQTTRLRLTPKNVGHADATFHLGVALHNLVTGEWHYQTVRNNISLAESSYFASPLELTFNTRTMTDINGTYEVVPALQDTYGQWHPIYYSVAQTVPYVIIRNGSQGTMTDISFAISASTIQVARTANITCDKYYMGSITYTSSDPSVATVSTKGIVTGVSEGTAQITVRGTEDGAYRATEHTFTVNVVPTTKQPLSVEAESNTLDVGQTTSLILPSDYTGNATYSSSDNSVVSVSTKGLVRALKSGEATIYINGDATTTYQATLYALRIYVSESVPAVDGFGFEYIPTVGDNNVATADNITLVTNVKNTSAETVSPAVVYYELECDNYVVRGYRGYTAMGSGATAEIRFDFAPYTALLTPGHTYKVRFYLDEAYTQPMNVPEISFLYTQSETITYTQHPKAWGTLSLPFNASLPEGLKAYEAMGYADGEVVLREVMSVMRGRPVLLCGQEGTYTFNGTIAASAPTTWGLLTGVYTPTPLEAGTYTLRPQSDLGFYLAQDATTLSPYEAYLTLPEGSYPTRLALPTLGGESVPVTAPKALTQPEAIYSLSGIRLKAPQKGINIIGGKKVVK